MGLEDSHVKSTPSEVKALGKDEAGEPCSEPWSYASVVGMPQKTNDDDNKRYANNRTQCLNDNTMTKANHTRNQLQ
jgi:hypothetical protein